MLRSEGLAHFQALLHCVKSVQIRSISPYSGRMRENINQKKLRIWTLSTPCWLHFRFLAYPDSFLSECLKSLLYHIAIMPQLFQN